MTDLDLIPSMMTIDRLRMLEGIVAAPTVAALNFADMANGGIFGGGKGGSTSPDVEVGDDD